MIKSTFNIVLCGFMGSGKSTLASLLAEALGRRWVDLDLEIEKISGKKISSIFSDYSEGYFRKVEEQTVSTISKETGLVIAVGGGTFLNPKNGEVLKRNSKIIWLQIPLSTAQTRISNNPCRPLIRKSMSDREWEILFQTREKSYQAVSDFIVQADHPIDEVVWEILRIYNKFLW